MNFKIEHKTKDYIFGKIKLWIFKVFYRSFKQRKSLIVLILSIQIILYTFFKNYSFIFLLIILIIVLIDFVVWLNEIMKEKKKIESYIKNGGEDIEIIINEKYIALKQDENLYQLTNWDEIKEIYILKKPKLISFKNRKTNYLFVLFESEISNGFNTLAEKIIAKSNVTPLG